MRRPYFSLIFLPVIFLLFSTVNSSNSSTVLADSEAGNDVEEEFEGATHWDTWHRELCDMEELDNTWRWSEAICLTYFHNFQDIKMEVLSWEPALVIYRDFFNQKEVENYLDFLKDMIFEEQPVVDDDGKDFYSKVRKANGTQVTPDDYLPIFESVAARIPTINWASSEDISALCYNPGGHYAVHYDYLEYRKEEDWDNWMREYGNRLATFIMVFKTADAGGATIFPGLEATVRPNVGDAFLWFNAKGDTSLEELSDHGGCPIYTGNKVISTIWIRMIDQPILENIDSPESISAELLIPSYF